ncbi:uncharacterized protein [Rutidosis leptorrhynchoides]|uniref:uncharacterized protein n=1 Tax=Rutidosis leptorrhynchoides TaxID=125765 RepID=UPI003A98D580
MYSRLFRCNQNPSAKVSERAGWDGSKCVGAWSWKCTLRGRTKAEFEDLSRLLNTVIITPGKDDSWRWMIDGNCNNSFATSVLSNLIRGKLFPPFSNLVLTQRNKMVSKKIEVFVWRAKRKRLPVLSELDKRGIDLHTVLCPLCNNDIETVDHSLLSCKNAYEIWVKVLKWLGFNNTPHPSLEELFSGKTSIQTSDLCAKIWQAVIWVCGYLIWKNRNQTVFKKVCWNPPVAVNEIQVKSFELIGRRCKDKKIEWHVWLHNPQSLIV